MPLTRRKPTNDCVSVWLAKKAMTSRAIQQYMADEVQSFRFPHADADLLARSMFAADFSLTYDDSFMEAEVKRSPVLIPTLVKNLEFCSRIPNEIAAAAKKRRINKSNYVVALPYFMYSRDDYVQPYASRLHEYANPRAPLRFIGSFTTMEPPSEAKPFSLPMHKKRVLMRKYDPIADISQLIGLQRDGDTVKVFSGASNQKLQVKTVAHDTPKEANQMMSEKIAEKLAENFRIEDGAWKLWIG